MSIQNIVDNMDITAIKVDKTNSVLVKDKNSSFSAWIDIYIRDNELNVDWNKYIFNLNNNDDIHQRDIQNNCDAFMMCTECAINYLESLGILTYKDDVPFIVSNND